MELFMWHLFRYFSLIFSLQAGYYLWRNWNRRETVFPSPDPARYSTVVSKQRHSWLEKIVFCFLQLFSRQWNHYNIVSLHTDRNAATEQKEKEESSESPVHEIRVTETTKYLLVGYHSRPTLDLVYLVMNLECSIFVIHILFYLPGIRKILSCFGMISARDTSYQSQFSSNYEYFLAKILESDRPILLLPGGAMECMKDYSQIHQLLWRPEMGFARVIRQFSVRQRLEEEQEQKENEEKLKRANDSHSQRTTEEDKELEPAPSKELLTREKQSKKKVIIKIIPFYTKYSESLYYTTEYWYSMTGKTVRNLMSSFQQSYLANITLLPVVLICILFSFGFFLLPLPLPVQTVFGEELVCNPDIDTSDELFTQRVKQSLEQLIEDVNENRDRRRSVGQGKADQINSSQTEPITQRKHRSSPLPLPLPSFEELFFKHSLLYSSDTAWYEKAYLFFLGFFGIVGNTLLQVIGLSSLALMYILLNLLLPVFHLFSKSILKKLRKQKIS